VTEVAAARPGAWRTDLVRLAAVLSGAAAAVHLSVARLHFDEYWLFGAGFVVSGVLQLAWAVAIWKRHDDRRLLTAGFVLQLGIAAVWVVSRTVGLPYGPSAGDPESIGPLDAQCTFDELLIVVIGAMALWGVRSGRRRFAVDGLELLALLATAATWFMLAAGAGHGH
jgi:predicted branched-subunit amino acid permease